MRKLLRRFKRAIRRVNPDIVAVKCPTCDDLIDAYEVHKCVNVR
jgi:hypothetical protein